ncbi:MAG: ribose 5-phosphate isomerase B [Lachnospiraceae bacterium]|nr:ribose 5-phosphate isomerase B [Lachnospiraceae bacterium]
MKIAIGGDHGGYDLKTAIIAHLEKRGIPYRDYGCFEKKSCDYPDFGKAVAQAIKNGEYDKGILVCTTGIGISMAANRISGVRCALCTDPYMAKMTREHNDANILSLGAGIVGVNLALEIVDIFLDTLFSAEEKHIRRIEGIET